MNKLKKTLLLTLIIAVSNTNIYSQINEKPPKPNYLSFQTGGMVDIYNSFGVRTFFAYQKDLKKNLQNGISYEHVRHLGRAATDHSDNLSANLSLLSLNYYYKLKLYKDRIFWTSGMGVGVVHLNWDDNDEFGPTVNASITLNIRVTKRFFIETSPLIVLAPINRFYYSPMNATSYKDFYAGTFFPIGFKVRL